LLFLLAGVEVLLTGTSEDALRFLVPIISLKELKSLAAFA
jgi:hypothetical protein